MIVAFYFRVGPTGGPFDLLSVSPRRYAISSIDPVEPDRGTVVPADLDSCGIEHACNLCGARVLESSADLQGDDWLEQIARADRSAGAIDTWWPWNAAATNDRYSTHVAELTERFGHVELCADCYQRHGDPDDWPSNLFDDVYGRERAPARCYPEQTRS